MSLRVWRHPIAEVLVPAGARHRVAFIPKDPAYGGSAADWHEWPLCLDGFVTGASEYDGLSDEVYCPCGDTLSGWDGTAAHLLRLIYQHCESKGHPRPVFER